MIKLEVEVIEKSNGLRIGTKTIKNDASTSDERLAARLLEKIILDTLEGAGKVELGE